MDEFKPDVVAVIVTDDPREVGKGWPWMITVTVSKYGMGSDTVVNHVVYSEEDELKRNVEDAKAKAIALFADLVTDRSAGA